ncbi:MAG: methyltransferase domain-containing protein, partial [Candidatus Ranarchaeia archaeon]
MFDQKRIELLKHLEQRGFVRSDVVKKAFLEVPREVFVVKDSVEYAYSDTPLSIGKGQTISAPHMVVWMCELLNLKPGLKLLEVGTGSGYHAAICAEIIAPTNLDQKEWGHVYSIEYIPELVKYAKVNLEKAEYGNRVTVIEGDGSLGYKQESPF